MSEFLGDEIVAYEDEEEEDLPLYEETHP